jgi:molybdenum cofactor guanylyltransferase
VGVLLAGGASSRFGGVPKGLALVKEVRIADRALIALKGATDVQIVVSNDPAAEEWFPSLPVVADAEPGLGPLAGIATALRVAEGAAVIVLAWDMPFVTAPLLRGMRALGELDGAAVIPVHGAGRIPEPLCAYYPPAALETCLRLLAAEERRASALAEALPRIVTIPERLLEDHGDLERLFMSVDTPEQLAAIGGEMPAARR